MELMQKPETMKCHETNKRQTTREKKSIAANTHNSQQSNNEKSAKENQRNLTLTYINL